MRGDVNHTGLGNIMETAQSYEPRQCVDLVHIVSEMLRYTGNEEFSPIKTPLLFPNGGKIPNVCKLLA